MALPSTPYNTPLSSQSPHHESMPDLLGNQGEVSLVAQLHTIDIGRLYEGDKEEAARLLRAALEDGVFYLNLQDGRFAGMMDTINEVLALSKELFELSEEEKMKFDVDKFGKHYLDGYKPVARDVGGKPNHHLFIIGEEVTFSGVNGKHDGFESYAIPAKGKLDFSARPSPLTSRRPLLTTFLTQARQILALLLSSLSSSLNLPTNASLTDLHRDNVPSSDILRLLHYLPQPSSETGASHGPHTDIGSLTLLFTKSPGLQVLLQNRRHTYWAIVDPIPNCAIVNIGDGLTMLTGGLLHSCLHRVAPPAGRSMEERYSVAYLQRAEDDVRLETLPGLESGAVNQEEVYTSREWLEKKFGILRRKT